MQNGILRVSITAPTGLAASGLKGYTIHNLFSMDFAEGYEAEYKSLRADKLASLKNAFRKHPSLLIIDEISMVSNFMLMKIHGRLMEILGSVDLRKLIIEKSFIFLAFGGISMLAFGDFLQLKPVNSDYAFETVTRKGFERVFKSDLQNINIWKIFEYR